MIALYIILGIIALFVLIFSLRVRINIDLTDDMYLWASILGIRIGLYPKIPKKYKLRNYTLKKIAKRDAKKAIKEAKKAEAKALKRKKKAAEKKAKKAAEAKLTKAERKAQKGSKPPIPDVVKLLLRTLGFFFPTIFSKVHFYVAKIKLRIGGADAAQVAMTYYAVSNALSPVLRFIDKHSNLHGMRRAEIEIIPDYLSESTHADVKVSFSISIGGLLGTVLKAVFKLIFGYAKIKPPKADETDNKPTNTQTDEKPKLADAVEQTA